MLNVALCDLMPYLQPYKDDDICDLDSIILFGREKATRRETYQYLNYPVLLSNVYVPLCPSKSTLEQMV